MSRSISRLGSRRRDDESGQAIIEFAVISLPLFLLFLLAIDGALFFYGYVTAANATREGARCGAVGASSANIIARVESELPGSAPSVTAVRADTNSDGVTGVGDQITVTATWTYEWLTPLASFGLDDTVTKDYTAKMRLETSKTDGTCG